MKFLQIGADPPCRVANLCRWRRRCVNSTLHSLNKAQGSLAYLWPIEREQDISKDCIHFKDSSVTYMSIETVISRASEAIPRFAFVNKNVLLLPCYLQLVVQVFRRTGGCLPYLRHFGLLASDSCCESISLCIRFVMFRPYSPFERRSAFALLVEKRTLRLKRSL